MDKEEQHSCDKVAAIPLHPGKINSSSSECLQQRMVLRGSSAVDKGFGDFRTCRRRDNGFIRPMADSYRKTPRMIPRPFPRMPAINTRHGMVANPFALTNLTIADFAAIFPSCTRMNQ